MQNCEEHYFLKQPSNKKGDSNVNQGLLQDDIGEIKLRISNIESSIKLMFEKFDSLLGKKMLMESVGVQTEDYDLPIKRIKSEAALKDNESRSSLQKPPKKVSLI